MAREPRGFTVYYSPRIYLFLLALHTVCYLHMYLSVVGGKTTELQGGRYVTLFERHGETGNIHRNIEISAER